METQGFKKYCFFFFKKKSYSVGINTLILFNFLLPIPILAEIRERDWCNVVTCHMDTAQAYVWRLQNFVLGEHILKPCPENQSPVKVSFYCLKIPNFSLF